MSIDSESKNTNKKGSIVKATIIGLAVGVIFILAAKFVNFVLVQ